jgi:hypothetical protein
LVADILTDPVPTGSPSIDTGKVFVLAAIAFNIASVISIVFIDRLPIL